MLFQAAAAALQDPKFSLGFVDVPEAEPDRRSEPVSVEIASAAGLLSLSDYFAVGVDFAVAVAVAGAHLSDDFDAGYPEDKNNIQHSKRNKTLLHSGSVSQHKRRKVSKTEIEVNRT